MKNFFVFFLVFVGIICSAQSVNGVEKIDYKVVYRLDYTKYIGSERKANENQVLIVKEDGTSYFMSETMIVIDSIQTIRSLDVGDIMLYKSSLSYLIKRRSNAVTHFELLGNDLLKYNEQIAFNWKLVNESKVISGLNCMKAIVDFEGREWIAWYAVDVPINGGPYKFYGLPGLILDLSDTQNLFHFSVDSLEIGSFMLNSNVSNYFVSDGNNTIQDFKKEDFHNLRKKYYQMSMDESLKYMNRGEQGVYSVKLTTLKGEEVRTNRKPKTKNFIEKYD